jgi:asparagine synthase (glutamine-hydrolysing)
MCGIAGAYGWTDDDVLGEMLGCIKHRGPDDQGRFVDPEGPVMLGMRRLSIVDLEGGAQPIYNEDETVAVVFNGEIYNYPDLRADLDERCHRFSTDAATAVPVPLWEPYGVRVPAPLNGMFAFAIWDVERESLFLARDRLGIKPLYYSTEVDGVAFASELPALLPTGVDRTLDERAVYNYFSLHYSPWPRTLLRDVNKVQPGTSLLVTEEGIDRRQYWRLGVDPVNGSMDTVASRLRDLLEASVERRLMADVPVGAFLSGGLDSTTVVALLSELRDDPVQTFSVAFEGETDESEEARFVADHFGTDHHEITVDLDSADVFEDLVTHYGEPLPDPAVLPTMVLSKHTAEHVKVVQTGSGADEIFVGYWMHRKIPHHRRLFGWLPDPVYRVADVAGDAVPPARPYLRYAGSMRDDLTAVERAACRFRSLPTDTYLDTDMDTDRSGLRDLVRDSFRHAEPDDLLQRISAFYLTHWLPDDILYKVDHATMYASLEARVPFLDHNVVEFAYNVPSRYVARRDEYKPLLKKAVSDVVPQRTLDRSKKGFGIQQEQWLRSDRRAIARWLEEDRVRLVPYLDRDVVDTLWSEHRSGKRDHGITMWKILNYVAWYHTHVHEE